MNAPSQVGSRLTVAVLLGVTLAALAAQIHWGLQPHYGYDEAWHVYLADISPPWKFLLAVAADPHPPLYYLLLRPLVAIGNEPVYPRLLSILPALLTIPLLYALLRKVDVRRWLALATVALLAASTSFEQVAVTVRSYSLTTLLLLAGLWFWLDLFPDCRGRPSRTSSVAALTLFSLAFGCLYAAAFVTATLLGLTLTALATQAPNSALRQNLRRYSRWPEWLGLLVVHLAGGLWFYFAWVRHINLQTPSHLAQFGHQPGQSAIDFLYRGLHRELALFTPFDNSLPVWLADAALLALALTIGWLALDARRQARPARLLLALSPLVLTLILALLGVLDLYPFGGGLRHQYVLFPFLLLLLPLALDRLPTPRRWGQTPAALLGAACLVAAALVVLPQYRSGPVSEAPARPWLEDELGRLFATGSDEPILVPAFALIPAYLDRIDQGIAYHSSYQVSRDCAHIAYQGWFAALLNWPTFETYRSRADDGGPLTLVKSQYYWDLPAVPDDPFFAATAKLLRRMDQRAIKVFAFRTAEPYRADPAALRRAAARHGFTLSEFSPTANGAIWRIERLATPAG